MKVLQSSIFRALIAIVVGALIIKYREETVHWLTVSIGVLFLISGLISCAVYYSLRRQSAKEPMGQGDKSPVSPSFPLVGIGSIVLGGILALMPTTFITGLMYVLAAILILGAISQYVSLGKATRFCKVGWFYWVPPTLILLISILMLVKPMEMFASPLFIIGWCMVVYGVTECLNTWMIYRARKQFEAMQQTKAAPSQQQDALVEETDAEDVTNEEADGKPKNAEGQGLVETLDSSSLGIDSYACGDIL